MVSYLNGCLPLTERATVRSGPGGSLVPDDLPPRGRVGRCPKLQKPLLPLVWMRSVDDWPLAKILNQISGGKPRAVAVDQLVVVTAGWCPPFEDRMSQSRGCGCKSLPNESSGADRSLKNSVGAIGWSWDGRLSHGGRFQSSTGCGTDSFTRVRPPLLGYTTASVLLPFGAGGSGRGHLLRAEASVSQR